MLVLTRRVNEKIVIPSLNITIQVVDVQRGRVRIGIQAPADVAIVREELCAGRPKATAEPVGVGAAR
jgi:carbon storage regulator